MAAGEKSQFESSENESFKSIEDQITKIQDLDLQFEKSQKIIKEEIEQLKHQLKEKIVETKFELNQLLFLKSSKEHLDQSNYKIEQILKIITTKFNCLKTQVMDVQKQIIFQHLIKKLSSQIDLNRKERFKIRNNLIKEIRKEIKVKYDCEKNKFDLVDKKICDLKSKTITLHSNMSHMSKLCEDFQAKCNLSIQQIEQLIQLNNELEFSIIPLKNSEINLVKEMKNLKEKIRLESKQNEDRFQEIDYKLNQLAQMLVAKEILLVEETKTREYLNKKINEFNTQMIQLDNQILELNKEREKQKIHRQTLTTFKQKVLVERNQVIEDINETLNYDEKKIDWKFCIQVAQKELENFKLEKNENLILDIKQELEIMKAILESKKQLNKVKELELIEKKKMIKEENEKFLQLQLDFNNSKNTNQACFEKINQEEISIDKELAVKNSKNLTLIDEIVKLKQLNQELKSDNQFKKEEIGKKELLLEAFAMIEDIREKDSYLQSSDVITDKVKLEKPNENKIISLSPKLHLETQIESKSLSPIKENHQLSKEKSSLLIKKDTKVAKLSDETIFASTQAHDYSSQVKSTSKRKISKFFVSRTSEDCFKDNPESKLRKISYNYDLIMNQKKYISKKGKIKPSDVGKM